MNSGWLGPLCNGLALLVSALAFWGGARRRGMATEGVFWIWLSAIFWGLSGATLLHVLLWEWPQGPILGGRSLYAGLLCGWAAAAWTRRQLGLTTSCADFFALSLAAGEAVGRLGCFFQGCCTGLPSSVPWAVYQHQAWRHPSQLYQSLAAGLGYGLLRFVESRGAAPGQLMATYLVAFSLCRWLLEFCRERQLWLGFSPAQWLALLLLGYGIAQGKWPPRQIPRDGAG